MILLFVTFSPHCPQNYFSDVDLAYTGGRLHTLRWGFHRPVPGCLEAPQRRLNTLDLCTGNVRSMWPEKK